MSKSQNGRGVALVTGGGRGIGAACSKRLAREELHVCVNDLVEERAEAVAEEIRAAGGSASAAVADISESSSVDALFDAIERDHGEVTTLVNNAGIGGDMAIRNVTDDFWERVIKIDLDAVLYCSRRAAGPMREARRGSIVSISSRAWLGWWGQTAYSAAKAGVIGLTRSLAVELASRGVRVNAITPGLIHTPLVEEEASDLLVRLRKSVPIGRLGTGDDIANAVAFLASDRGGATTGQVLYVCGGKGVYAYPDWPDAR